jgi:histone H3/H4
MSEQPQLFGTAEKNASIESVLLYALGDFQSRGKVLTERELALDRLRGAFKRAAEKFGITELTDEQIAETLEKLGAKIVKVQSFVAKHPFRVTVSNDLADKAKEFYRESLEND